MKMTTIDGQSRSVPLTMWTIVIATIAVFCHGKTPSVKALSSTSSPRPTKGGRHKINNSTPPKTTTSSVSLGQRIQDVRTVDDVLHVASDFWLPTDLGLPTYYYNQAVHNDSRRRWASQLLGKLEMLLSSGKALNVINDCRLTRLILAAALPQRDNPSSSAQKITDTTKCNNWMLDSLVAIYAVAGRSSAERTIHLNAADEEKKSDDDNRRPSLMVLPAETTDAVQKVMEYCILHSNEYSLEKACQIHWAVNGLRTRVSNFQLDQHLPASVIECENQLLERIAGLPFDIIPLGVDWPEVIRMSSSSTDPLSTANTKRTITEHLVDVIPFQKDTITTRTGNVVQERRGTSWVADEGIGALAYSGKLMMPHSPLPTVVKMAMSAVEDRLGLTDVTTTGFFDCALCNHYADKDAACKYHTDPEHGTFWHTTTVVVAAGSDRKFSFKPIETSWHDWDCLKVDSPAESATIPVFSGDVIVMKDSCNDDFFHAVHAGTFDDDRVSLVLKRALDRNGRKGHGLPGEGRRSGKKTVRRR